MSLILISDKGQLSKFPKNLNNDFQAQLINPIENGRGVSKIALTEIRVNDNVDLNEYVFVCLNCIKPSQVYNLQIQLVRAVTKSTVLESPIYIEVNKNFIADVRVQVLTYRDNRFIPATLDGETVLTLHVS